MSTSKSKTQRAPENRSRRQVNIRCSEETIALLEAILERDGVPYNAQVERAIAMWAKSKGIMLPGQGA